jgi:hypothetical protein
MARIQMTPMVKAALWALRIYLLVRLGLILFKFIREMRAPRPGAASQPGAALRADATSQPAGSSTRAD